MNRLPPWLSADQDDYPVSGPFEDEEALTLLRSYKKDPSSVPCPDCGPDKIEILNFIEPVPDEEGHAVVTYDPQVEYGIAVYCHGCLKVSGIVMQES